MVSVGICVGEELHKHRRVYYIIDILHVKKKTKSSYFECGSGNVPLCLNKHSMTEHAGGLKNTQDSFVFQQV